MKKLFFLLLSLCILSCGSDDSTTATNPTVNSADRSQILTHWADNIIIPSYTELSNDLSDLKTNTESFNATPNQANLTALRNSWITTYTSFQKVEMFNIGKAMDVKYTNFTNIYPTSTSKINTNIQTGIYSLTLSTSYDEQGFPALDYLINGLGSTDADLINFYSTDVKKENYKAYLLAVVTRISNLTNEVLTDWNTNYRNNFITNSGSSATASFDKLTNSYISYFETYLRKGKVGLPAGKFSSSKDATLVEGYYHKEISKTLLKTALQASLDFFNGKEFNGSTTGKSYASYLNELNAQIDENNLTTTITNQFTFAQTKVDLLNNNLADEVINDNNKMLNAYDELQKIVILLKTNMVSALNVQIAYTDNDGD